MGVRKQKRWRSRKSTRRQLSQPKTLSKGRVHSWRSASPSSKGGENLRGGQIEVLPERSYTAVLHFADDARGHRKVCARGKLAAQHVLLQIAVGQLDEADDVVVDPAQPLVDPVHATHVLVDRLILVVEVVPDARAERKRRDHDPRDLRC